ncbi:hypothetical protein GNZ06_20605 [Aeromonas jandaei]|uniref:RloB domain-containing protein n=1 Tax=Aeromonas jandaei TaxID=650 RepID=UPI0019340D24|nr:RloB domain-containing protein [Aeromonas jandaei]MBM0493429.1 RloB domain-containing protein [Aeromonas jandaei]MBM0571162.1 hypothetical protein [Aeromonas jandaei]
MAREKRKLYTTILFVGEGLTEKIFIQYLRGMYSERKAKVTVKSANGKGPKNVIEDAIASFKQDGYDYCCAVLDTDLEWTPALIKNVWSAPYLQA